MQEQILEETDINPEVYTVEEGEDEDEDRLILQQLHSQELQKGSFYMSPILKRELDKIRYLVLEKDRDWVGIVDGDEGVGKSVLALQICKTLDPNFDLQNIVFNADDFMDRIKKAKKGTCILLDEGYAAANARASLSEVNRSMVALATEMRQKNLFVIICIPSFFDLDKYFAIHRSRALFHVYFNANGDRGQFLIFPKQSKKLLYILGKKKYSYMEPRAPYPPMRFVNYYPIDELGYRELKASAFKKRTVSLRAKQWQEQRDALVIELAIEYKLNNEQISNLFRKYQVKSIDPSLVGKILARFASKS